MCQLIEQGVMVDAIIADIHYGIHKNKFVRDIFDEMWTCLEKLIKNNGNIVLSEVNCLPINWL